MSGPLEHFMPVIAANRHRTIFGDPYFPYVSILTEFNGLDNAVNTAPVGNQNLMKDKSANNTPLRIIGTPHRLPVDLSREPYTVPQGVSDYAVYHYATDLGATCAIMVTDNSHLDFAALDFEITLKVRADHINSSYIAGRWVAGGRAWLLSYDNGTKQLRFNVSVDGTIVFADTAYFRMNPSAINDGIITTEFFDDTWHEIRVWRTGNNIYISVDGITGGGVLTINSAAIYQPGATTSMTCIGSASAHLTDFQASSNIWEGMIDDFKITIDGTVELHLDFNVDTYVDTIPIYWGAWWVGNFPQSKHLDTFPLSTNVFQDDIGLIKLDAYVGLSWIYDDSINFQGENFTVEIFGAKFAYRDNMAQTIIGMGWSVYKCWRLVIKDTGTTTGTLYFEYANTSGTVTSVALMTGMAIGDYYTMDLTVVRNGTSLRFYVDGSLLLETTINVDLYDASTQNLPLTTYASMSNTDAAEETTRIKALRITKGIARYRGSSYRVPSLPLYKSIP